MVCTSRDIFVRQQAALPRSDESFEKSILLLLEKGPGSRNKLKLFLESNLNRFMEKEVLLYLNTY
ncbi:unnamed protein product [Meloidogyne enterolobii]|uniref:Uncharacterized protein n=1 Tax=Meloidogyne enterolobii TaxID=390850 RepID=A0ACB1B2E6_MELEN